jgi:hypothetical protein
MNETLAAAVALALLLAWGCGAVLATPETNKPEPPQTKEKTRCFCDGLSLPAERQCPLMSDL